MHASPQIACDQLLKVCLKSCCIDRLGNYAISPKFEAANPFYDGLAAVKVSKAGASMWG